MSLPRFLLAVLMLASQLAAGSARAQGLSLFGWGKSEERSAPEAPPTLKTPPASRAEVTASFAPVVKRVAPSVVNVYGAQRPQGRSLFADDPFFQRFFGGGAPPERMRQSVGSGVIVSPDGVVITNHHVIEGMTDIRIALADRREFEAEVRLRDPKTDLAILKIKAPGAFPALDIGNSDVLEVGDLVLAIGNPFGVGQTVTQGIVSALARTQVGVSDYQFFIQTDAAINPGNSGGALVDIHGRLIGINTAIFSRSGGSHGIGFAIPSAMVRPVLASAEGGAQTVRRPWFGARMQSVTADIAEAMGLEKPSGALVASVVEKSPAAEAGVQAGDVIVAVDAAEVVDPDGFGFRLATKPIGGTASVTVLRGGKRLILPVRLVSAPEIPPRESLKVRGRSPFTGATWVNLSPAVIEELSVPSEAEGLAVAAIDPGSPAEEVGFQKGDVLVAINGQALKATRDLDRLSRERAYLWRITINRGGRVFTSVIGG